MKETRPYPATAVSPKAEASVLRGHPWIYDTEVRQAGEDCLDGELVDVFGPKGGYLGTGFYNSHSKIRIRLLSRNANDRFDEAFWERRLRYAWDYRKAVMGEDIRCCRLIFGEADAFPGLTVDRFDNILVAQTLSLGMERRKGLLFSLLYKILTGDGQKIDGIYERNDVAIRRLEGMEEGKGFYPLDGVAPPAQTRTEITENGIAHQVDFENGQKTGFFLDQKYNRQAVAKLAAGRRVLDCFTHTGSFALNAAKGGAEWVEAVDVSASAVEMARENARHTVHGAERGYKEINYRAMKLLPRGGYLATCSCSHFMKDELFRKMLVSAAADAQVSLRQIEARQQAPDHPILWNVPETDYLKFYLFQVV